MAPSEARGLRLLVTVTFNPNQLKSHLLPLVAMDEVEAVVLVADVEPPELPKLTGVVPPAKLQRRLGRAGSKLATCVRLARAQPFDWVIGFNLVPHGLNAELVARWTGARSIYHMIGGDQEWRGGGWASENGVLGRLPRPSRVVERALLRQIRHATAVATMGPRGRESLIAAGVPAGQVHVIPPSADLDRFGGIARGDVRYDVVTVGALSPRKRTTDLLKALARLGSEGLPARAAIAGGGALRDALAAEARALGIEDRVDFLGQVDDVERVYGGARVFALMSDFEGMPIAMLDAMAAGLPVVSSDVGEIGTLIEHGRNGLLYPAGGVDALTEHLRTVLTDPALERRLADAGAADVRTGFSAAAVADCYRRIFAGTGSREG